MGRYDNVKLYIDNLEQPLIDFTLTADTVHKIFPSGDFSTLDNFVVAANTSLERNKWYSIILEYKGLYSVDDAYDTDYLVLRWNNDCIPEVPATDYGILQTSCYHFLDENNLAFSSGGITDFTEDVSVKVTLPPGFQYVTDSARYFAVNELAGNGTPDEPTATPPAINEQDSTQTLTWTLTDDMPVGKSVRYNYNTTLLYAFAL
jgi:hypothetical protein